MTNGISDGPEVQGELNKRKLSSLAQKLVWVAQLVKRKRVELEILVNAALNLQVSYAIVLVNRYLITRVIKLNI